MRTTLRQQLDLINALENVPSKPLRVRMLRTFLTDNGYESDAECKHMTVFRVTGKCTNCGTKATPAQPSGSDENLEALRDTLRTPEDYVISESEAYNIQARNTSLRQECTE